MLENQLPGPLSEDPRSPQIPLPACSQGPSAQDVPLSHPAHQLAWRNFQAPPCQCSPSSLKARDALSPLSLFCPVSCPEFCAQMSEGPAGRDTEGGGREGRQELQGAVSKQVTRPKMIS